MARFSRLDADAYKTYSADTMRQCRFIRDFLLSTAPDPTSFKPRDIKELVRIGGKFMAMGEDRMYDTIRFWTMSVAEYLDEYFETDVIKAALSGSGIIGTALGIHSPGTAYVLLHHYMGDVDGTVGSWGFARGRCRSDYRQEWQSQWCRTREWRRNIGSGSRFRNGRQTNLPDLHGQE
jgi:phytoene dehydrogenase-like protein